LSVEPGGPVRPSGSPTGTGSGAEGPTLAQRGGTPPGAAPAARRRIPLSGILLVFLGILFLADTLNLFGAESVMAAWWPAILVVIGLEQIINSPSARFSGLILVLIGAIMLTFTVGPLEWEDFVRFWPVLLIVLGVIIMFKPRSGG
jgi:hypothetical protein